MWLLSIVPARVVTFGRKGEGLGHRDIGKEVIKRI